jgi:hypothetical protein
VSVTRAASCAARVRWWRSEIPGYAQLQDDEGSAGLEGLEEIVVNKDHGEGLDKARPRPAWLDVLLDKYRRPFPF